MKKLSALIALSLCATPLAYAGNGGGSCGAAVNITSGQSFTADTTAATNWMAKFGPAVSPSNDVVYSFVAPADTSAFSITPTASNYAFSAYLIPSCVDPVPPNTTAAEPVPIGATATVGADINPGNMSTPLTAGNTYYLAVTGTAAGGANANGTASFDVTLPVTLQSFEID
jgi:hypothetical protein